MNTLEPATESPFWRGEAVFYMPTSFRMLAPPPQISAIVLDPRSRHTTLVMFDDKHEVHVSTRNLAYRAHCPHCYRPAVVDFDRRRRPHTVCPRCARKALNQPLPDEAVMFIHPARYWHLPMIMSRAVANPTWTYRQCAWDADRTRSQAVLAMLNRIGLPGPQRRETWHMNDRLRFAAIIDDERLFVQTYLSIVPLQAAA
jgi:hypothetical protein